MVASAQATRANVVTIDVADAERSRAFYATYFGLKPACTDGSLESQAEQGVGPIALRLRERARVSVRQSLEIEVEDPAEVLDLYLLLILCDLRASLPRTTEGRLSTVVEDPDGHRVSVWARAGLANESRRERTRGVHGWMRPGTSPRRHGCAASTHERRFRTG